MDVDDIQGSLDIFTFLVWGFLSVDMGALLCKVSVWSVLLFGCGSPQSFYFYFFFIESSFVSKSQYIVHVRSLVIRSPLRYTHDVLIGSFSDTIFLLWVYFISFLWAYFTSFVLMCATLSIQDIFHLHILITWAWPIMKDIEPIDLGSGDRPRKFKIVTHPTFWSKQYHIHIHTLICWTSWSIHDELCMTLLHHSFTWFFIPYIYYYFHSFCVSTRYGLRWLDLWWALYVDV